MRLFIGLRFNPDTARKISLIQNEQKEAGVQGTYTAYGNLHCTLVFIGEYDQPDRIIQLLARIPFAPFQMEFEGTGLFKKLFYLKLKAQPELEEYVCRLKAALAQEGIPFDRKAFFPHVTLIRRAQPLDQLQRKTSSDSFTCSQVVLYLSKRVADRLTYIPLYIQQPDSSASASQ